MAEIGNQTSVSQMLREKLVSSGKISDGWIFQEILDQNCYLKDFILPYLGEPGLIIDIGAHIGTFSALAALNCTGSSVVALEPEPENFSYLQQNIRNLNLADRISAYQMALWNVPGEIELYVDESNSGGHSAFKEKAEGEPLAQNKTAESTLRVQTDTLDNFLVRLGKADLPIQLLKIDTEGAERAILEGAKETLGRTRVIVGELHGAFVTPETLREILSDFEVALGEAVSELQIRTFWAVRRNLLTPIALKEFTWQTQLAALQETGWRLNLANESLESQLANERRALTAATAKNEWYETKLASLQTDYDEALRLYNLKEAEVEALKDWIANKESSIQKEFASFQNTLVEKDKYIQNLHQHLQQKIDELDELKSWVATTLEQKDNDLRQLQALVG
jgi:FkbM family methyltransferase